VRKYNLDAIYRRDIVSAVQNYFEFYDYYKIFGGKREEPIELKTENYWLYGIVDWLITPEKGFLIIDHKTAKKVDRERHIFQMKMYGLILSKLKNIPADFIKYLIYYPRLNYKDEFSVSNDEILKVEDFIINKIKEIESCTEWPAKKSFLCQWCSYFNSPYCK
jgi:CRISPR/Cas system-associated exonuclease Cas4 (RecB family)